MTDLILEYGNQPYPRFSIKPNEISLFPSTSFLPYFSINSQSDLVVQSNFFNNRDVSDVHRYDLRYDGIRRDWILVEPITNILTRDFVSQTCCCPPKDQAICSDNNILFILESPHKDEYCKGCFNPLAPANGKTGERFLSRFKDIALPIIISRLNILEKYSICFVNPVPFQTSLYFIHKKNDINTRIRNNVWKKLYRSNIGNCEAGFKSRIQSYSPKIIINCCTTELKGEVEDTLKKTIPIVPRFERKHPSSW